MSLADTLKNALSALEVVTDVLQEHGLKGREYEFTLNADYPKREQVKQYRESDQAFIERLLNYTLRTEAGEEPLALLKLRNFRLPDSIFSTAKVAVTDPVASTNSDAAEVNL